MIREGPCAGADAGCGNSWLRSVWKSRCGEARALGAADRQALAGELLAGHLHLERRNDPKYRLAIVLPLDFTDLYAKRLQMLSARGMAQKCAKLVDLENFCKPNI